MYRNWLTAGLALAITFAQACPFAVAADTAPPVAPPIKRTAPPTPQAGTTTSAAPHSATPPKQPSASPSAPPAASANAMPTQQSATTIDRGSAQQAGQLSELENLLFGAASHSTPIQQRVERLETEVFHKTEPSLDQQQRIDRLRETLIGPGASAAPYPPAAMPDPNDYAAQQRALMQQQQQQPLPNANYDPAFGLADPGSPYYSPNQQQQVPVAQQQHRQIAMPPAPDLNSHESTREIDREHADKYALEVVNEIRAYNGLSPLGWDTVAAKVAHEHVLDLSSRSTVSHNNSKGENPDLRYTKAGGTDSMLESLVSLKTSGRVPLSKSLVYQIIKQLTDSQDDRDALLAPLATQFGFSFDNNKRNDKVIAVSEIVTDVADIEPIPTNVKVGDKVEIKGHIKGPYRFAKISLAWEGMMADPGAAQAEEEEQDEALPYFPPLDYTAYSRKAERDWEKTTRALQILGLGAVLAGSVFMPPVALAAPLIMTAGPRAPKPVSEIPIKGGVKVSGNSFEFKSPISKDNKEGIYYITVWVEGDTENNPIAISRRAIIAHAPDADAPATSKADGDDAVAVAEKHGKNKDGNANK